MIIQCINCDKKFEVNSELIPNNGRTIQCGSCNHVWFYNPSKVKTLIEKEKKEIASLKSIVKKKKKKISPKKKFMI